MPWSGDRFYGPSKTRLRTLVDSSPAFTPNMEGTASASRRMLALVCLALVLSMTTWFSATAVTPQLASALNMDAREVAWLTIAVQIGFVVGALSISISGLADRLSLRLLMAISAAAAGLANLALLWSSHTAAALVARFGTGLALAGVYPPALKLIATWYRRGRGFAFGTVIGAMTLGSAAPHLVRGLTSALDWHVVVTCTSIFTLIGALIIARFVAEGPHSFVRSSFSLGQAGKALGNRAVLLVNIGYFGHMWELYAMWSWFLAYSSHVLQNDGIQGAAMPSLVTFGVIGVGLVGCLLGGLLADTIGRTATTAGMMTTSGVCALLIGFAFNGPFWLFLLISITWGMSVVGDSAQFSTIATEVGDPRYVGTVLAVQLGIGFALTVLAIRIVPSVAEIVGWRWTFLVLVPGPVLGALAMLLLRRLPEAKNIAGGLK